MDLYDEIAEQKLSRPKELWMKLREHVHQNYKNSNGSKAGISGALNKFNNLSD